MNIKLIRRYLRYALSASLLLGLIAGAVTVYAAFPGANGKIAFDSDRDGNEEVYVMNADGTGQTNLSNNPAWDGIPVWSSDGTKIIFSSMRDGDFEVYVMNADGSGQNNLTNNPGQTDYNGSWSPDGTKIVFTSLRDGNSEIYTMNADGSGQTNISNNAAWDDTADWSPDGTKIAFGTVRTGGCCPNPQDHEIFVMNADGSNPTNLTNNSDPDSDPDWSPDGTKIAFNKRVGLNHEVFVMNADGSNQTNLTNSPGNDGQNSWSPDGTKIAYSGYRDEANNLDIYVMNADGTVHTRLTNATAYDSYPDWQPKPIFNFNGFFQPVDNLPTLNLVKAGQGIPVKFSLNGDQGLDIFAAGYPLSQKIDCDSTAAVDGIEVTLTAGSSSLSYNPSTDTYTYVWKTEKAWANTCRQLILKLNDGTYHLTNFKFK